MIDLHMHILPGLDDGARTLAEGVSMARAAVADGIRTIAATPHVRADYPTRPSQMEFGVAELRDALEAEGIALDVRTGGEIALDHLARLEAEEMMRFGLASSRTYLLLEFPYYGWPLTLASQLFDLRKMGITAVLAHPERNTEVQAAPERLRQLVADGALVQLTSASLDGRLGRATRKTAFRLLDLGLAHLIGSDAHAPDLRAVGMSAAVKALGDVDLARWLTDDVPAAIVADGPIPERPRSRSGRSLGRRFWF